MTGHDSIEVSNITKDTEICNSEISNDTNSTEFGSSEFSNATKNLEFLDQEMKQLSRAAPRRTMELMRISRSAYEKVMEPLAFVFHFTFLCCLCIPGFERMWGANWCYQAVPFFFKVVECLIYLLLPLLVIIFMAAD